MITDEQIAEAVQVLTKADRLVVSSGAGISKESGVPTFRDAQTGLWAKYDPQQLATPDAFRRDPNLVWSWYMFRRGLVAAVKPNPGHYAIMEMEGLIPEVVIITQNVDSLHEQAGSSDIVRLHGSLSRYKCFAGCQGDPTLVDLDSIEYEESHPPLCPSCGEFVRPDVVWFTESLPADAISRAFHLAEKCDVMLVVGTSGLVQPAASLPAVAKQSGATIIEVNPQPSMITSIADLFLQGPSGEVLPALVEGLNRSSKG